MSLEGLSALIQLESTRLEAARADSSNQQQIQSAVQQRGISTAQSKLNASLQRIDARYTKECAEADVRKLEARLARYRKAERLALQIGAVAGVLNLAGNFGHFISDLAGAQKNGDIAKSLQSPPLNPGQVTVSRKQREGSSGNTTYISGSNKDGSETIYSYDVSGSGTAGNFRTATITNQDKEQIGGEEYMKLKEQFRRDLSFAEIQEINPKLAERIMEDKFHGMARGEVDNFLEVAKSAAPLYDQHERIENGLISTGKLDKNKFSDGIKSFVNMLVQTLQDTQRYFDAYLQMKDKADTIEEELRAAKDKLIAAKRRLEEIEQEINSFAGRGA
ncbi:MAG: hypothetical protein KatS3mg068_0031 [Candidatus Sericytochromatia bacterium]|nr:MAG: hypothetical protein KatS3mg068_0031 [Candidatus Sericytochromatia bacterium]